MATVKKPAIPAKYLKGRILREGTTWFESVEQANGIYYWKRLSQSDPLVEDSMYQITTNSTAHTLAQILKELRLHPESPVTWVDYVSFYENRTKYPDLWNTFLNLTRE